MADLCESLTQKLTAYVTETQFNPQVLRSKKISSLLFISERVFSYYLPLWYIQKKRRIIQILNSSFVFLWLHHTMLLEVMRKSVVSSWGGFNEVAINEC